MTEYDPTNDLLDQVGNGLVDGLAVRQFERLNIRGSELLERTYDALNELLTVTPDNVSFSTELINTPEEIRQLIAQLNNDVQFNENVDWLRNLSLSAGDEDFQLNPAVLGQLANGVPTFVLPPAPVPDALPTAPSDPGAPLFDTPPERPTLPSFTAPNIDLSLTAPEYTDATGEVPAPVLSPIVLPLPPTLNIDSLEFTSVRPAFTGQDLDAADFQFVNETYDPLLVDRTKQLVLDMMDGKSGLPAAVENALYERAREREVEAAEREVGAAADDWASKGYKYPGGVLAARVDRIRGDAERRVTTLGREQFIEAWRIQIEQFRQALAQGIALEDLWLRQFAAAEDRRLQAARFTLDLAISIYNAQVARLNAESTAYQAEAGVFRELIQAEAVKVQAYAEQLRGAQILGELNEQEVRIFAERVRALQVNAEVYRARVEGYTARLNAERNRVETYRAQLESNAVLAGIYETDVRAYGEGTRAELSKVERFRVLSENYGRNVDAWKTSYDAKRDVFNAEVERERLTRDVYLANLERTRTFIDAERGRIAALASKYDAMSSEIAAKSSVETGRVELILRKYLADLEKAKAASDIALKNGEINIQSSLNATNLLLRARETAAQTLAQLAAGFTSAAGVSASIGSSQSLGYSYSESWSGSLNGDRVGKL